jgi:TPR repeat protein
MSPRSCCAALALGTALAGAAARADFQGALKEFNAGHYEAAQAQFLALAELGDCSSQFNLGAMALKGQGGAQDTGSGVGWLEAAAGNGCGRLVGDKLGPLESQLSAAESHAAAAIVARYGPEALRAEGVLGPRFTCPGETPAGVLESPAPESPPGHTRESAIVIVALSVGVDGRARDPEILLAAPGGGFAAAAIEAWLNSRFSPATRSGAPVASRLEAARVFSVAATGGFAGSELYRSARQRADAGDADARYLVGLSATHESSLGVSYAQAGQMLLASARDGDAPAQYWVGSQLRASAACHPPADGAVWLRHAAAGGSAAAQLIEAEELLAGAPSGANVAQARELLGRAGRAGSYYVRKHVVALLAASPLDAVRDPAAALTLAKQLEAGEIRSDPQMFEALAAAYAASGDFRHAAGKEQLAIRRAQALGWSTRAMSERLAAYRAGQPWHGALLALAPLGG